MSDFFGRLVKRALSPEPSVRPRALSRYEPLAEEPFFQEVAPGNPSVSGRSENPKLVPASYSEREIPAGRRGSPQPQGTAPREAAHSISDDRNPAGNSPGFKRLDAPVAAERIDSIHATADLTTPVMESRALDPGLTRTGPRDISTPPPASSILPASSPTSVHTGNARLPEPQPASTVAGAAPVPSEHDTSPDLPASPEQLARIVKPVMAPPTARALAAEVATRRDEMKTVPPAKAPDVHITIGRLEIRATVAAPAIPGKSRAVPRLTLDEYLKRTGGGTG